MITRKVDTKGSSNLSAALSNARDNYGDDSSDSGEEKWGAGGYESDSSGPAFKPSRRSVSWSLNRNRGDSVGEDDEDETGEEGKHEMEYLPPPPSSPSSPTAKVNVSLSSNEDNADDTNTAEEVMKARLSFFETGVSEKKAEKVIKNEKKVAKTVVDNFTTQVVSKKKKRSYAGTAKMNGRYSANISKDVFEDIETARPKADMNTERLREEEEEGEGGPNLVDAKGSPEEVKKYAKSRRKGGYGKKGGRGKISQYFVGNKNGRKPLSNDEDNEDDDLNSESGSSTSEGGVLPLPLSSSLLSPPRTPAVKHEFKGRVTRALSVEGGDDDDVISLSDVETGAGEDGDNRGEEVKQQGQEMERKRKRGVYGSNSGSRPGVTVTPKISAFSTRRIEATTSSSGVTSEGKGRASGSGKKRKGKPGRSKYFEDIQIPELLTNAVTPATAGKEVGKGKRRSYGKSKKKKINGEEELERQREYFRSLDKVGLRTEG